MIVKSATGDVDLSVPENVRRGMLFRGNGRDFVAACDTQFGFNDGAPYTFLGCHPEIARREDCERFGIPLRCEQHGVPDAPIDAGAHGFARTREGFAVDLRRECPTGAGYLTGGATGAEDRLFRRAGGDGYVPPLGDLDRFVGLDMRHARAEDVERLCCSHRDARGYLCSLAIGDHAEHEDIAAGVKWRESPTTGEVAAWDERAATPGTSESIQRKVMGDYQRASFRGIPFPPEQTIALADKPSAPWTIQIGEVTFDCSATPEAPRVRPMGRSAVAEPRRVRVRVSGITHATAVAAATALKSGTPLVLTEQGRASRMLAIEWALMHSPAGSGYDLSVLAEEPRACEVERIEPACEGCGAKGVAGKRGGTFWLCEPGCPAAYAAVVAARREADAPLVALVNAVPAWANPNAWRAAVLAVHEASVGQSTPDAWRAAECERAIGIMVAVGCAADAWSEIEQIALDAYRRAIAPHKAPAPEREGATWRSRGPQLTVDDGRDE